jgi:hypothetical protein
MQDGVEIPFVTTVSEPQSSQIDTARVLHLHEQDGALVFDLAMPERAYTELEFHLHLQDFVATAEIAGVGEFRLFDLSREHLARETTVQLPEMHERTLHITLHAQGSALHMDDLEGVDVAPDRSGQSLYTAVATTATFANTEHETIAEVDVPAHVPVQRIRFETNVANFLRRVRVEAWPANDANDVETISGTISSTHRMGLADTQLVVPMTLGANLQGPAHMRVIVENDIAGNGVETPLPLSGITLEMREHKICFDAKSGTRLELAEGGDDAVPGTLPALTETSWGSAGAAVLGATSVLSQAAVPGPASRRPSRLPRILLAIALGVLCCCIAAAVWMRRPGQRRDRL